MYDFTGVAAFSFNNRVIDFGHQTIRGANLSLPDNVPLRVGFDQSTSCIGLSIKDAMGNMKIICDLHNDKLQPDEFFFEEVRAFLRRTFTDNLKIDLIASEAPPPSTKSSYTRDLLNKLHGRITEWCAVIPCFSRARYVTIYPQTWKARVPNTHEGMRTIDRNNKSKLAMAEDICTLNPLFTEYKDNYLFKDYDGFDAYGIISGAEQVALTDDGYPKIYHIKEKQHKSLVAYKVFTEEQLRDDSDCVLRMFGLEKQSVFDETLFDVLKPHYVAFNDDKKYNLHDNIVMASTMSPDAIIFSDVPRKYYSKLSWNVGRNIQSNEVVVMYVGNASRRFINKAVMQFFETNFDYSEVVESV